MNLITDVRERMKNAMKEKDTISLDTLRNIVSACTNELVSQGKSPQDEITDELVLKVISKLVKQRKDAIAQYRAGGREDLAHDEESQLAVLETFLPPQMAEEEIRKIAEQKKIELGITDKAKAGIVTGAVMKEVAGNADGKLVKSIVESLF